MLQSIAWKRLSWERALTTRRPIARSLSSTPAKLEVDGEGEKNEHPQAFVKAKLSPGEWDPKRTDPYFRPKPNPRFISAEDFANRPAVGFDNEFSSYRDNMIELTWMDQNACKTIYESYINLMVTSHQNHQTTSHEYVVRLIAEKYQINTIRVAGIIQLQHAEEQMARHNPELLCPEQADHAEQVIQQNIRDAYKSEKLQPPRRFLEDPAGNHGRGEPDEISTQWSKLDDIYDLEKRLDAAHVRDAARAQILIDNHLYKEDKDEAQEFVKLDAAAQRLIKAKEKLQKVMETEASNSTSKTTIPYPETNGNGESRRQWKYVAQIVNTRKLKKKKHEQGRRGHSIPTSYTNNTMGNTLVEQNGELRVATVEEAKQTAWKPTRTGSNEYLYEGVKKAWIERTLRGNTEVWGKGQRKTRASDSVDDTSMKSDSDTLKDETETKADLEVQDNHETSSEVETVEPTSGQNVPKDENAEEGESGKESK